MKFLQSQISREGRVFVAQSKLWSFTGEITLAETHLERMTEKVVFFKVEIFVSPLVFEGKHLT